MCRHYKIITYTVVDLVIVVISSYEHYLYYVVFV